MKMTDFPKKIPEQDNIDKSDFMYDSGLDEAANERFHARNPNYIICEQTYFKQQLLLLITHVTVEFYRLTSNRTCNVVSLETKRLYLRLTLIQQILIWSIEENRLLDDICPDWRTATAPQIPVEYIKRETYELEPISFEGLEGLGLSDKESSQTPIENKFPFRTEDETVLALRARMNALRSKLDDKVEAAHLYEQTSH